jgi:hypothetical protein
MMNVVGGAVPTGTRPGGRAVDLTRPDGHHDRSSFNPAGTVTLPGHSRGT